MQAVELAMAQFDLCFFLASPPLYPILFPLQDQGVQEEYKLCINKKKFVIRKLKLPKA